MVWADGADGRRRLAVLPAVVTAHIWATGIGIIRANGNPPGLLQVGASPLNDSIALLSGLVHMACIHPVRRASSAKHAHSHAYTPARIWEP